MHFDGTFNVKATKDRVFALLMNPEELSKCMPDLQELEVKSPDEYTAVIKAGVSFFHGNFDMHFNVVEKVPPTHTKIVAHGTGIRSTISLETIVDLLDGPKGETTIKWSAEAEISGMLASVGQRLVAGQAEKIVEQLFDGLKEMLAAPGP